MLFGLLPTTKRKLPSPYFRTKLINLYILFHCSSKRGLDLGLGRGFSGSQAAKHLMGLAAANFAGGPGRRRRSEEEA